MTGMLTLATREVMERRTVLIAALAAGLMPFASPLFPGVTAARVADARDVMALVVAAVLGISVALLVGASVVGRDLAEGRLGFDFARPLGGLAICGGKFLGAIAVVLLVVMLALAPTSVVGGGIFSTSIPSSIGPIATPLGFMLIAILLLVPLAHAVGIAFRSRSGWLTLDLVACAVVLLVAATAARRLLVNQAPRLLTVMAVLSGLLVILALWIASVVQVTRGRTSLRSGHRAMSIALWSMLLGGVAVLDGYTRWVIAAGPEDVITASGFSAPRGDWAVVYGTAAGRGDFEPMFLVDTASDRFVRLGSATFWGGVEFSDDGSRAVRLETVDGEGDRFELQVVDLDTERPAMRETTLSFPVERFGSALSPDGRRFALLQGGSLSVFEVDSGKTLAAMRLPDPPAAENVLTRLAFQGADRLRVYTVTASLEIHELAVGSRALTTISGPAASCAWSALSWTPEHDRLLGWSECAGLSLLDGRTGTTLVDILPRKRFHGLLLSDGRLVLTGTEAATGMLELFTRDGVLVRTLDLGPGDRVVVGGEAEPGRLVLALVSGPEFRTDRSRLLLVDLDAGQVEELAEGLVPAASPTRWRSARPSPRLFYRGTALVRFDPRTRQEHPLAGR